MRGARRGGVVLGVVAGLVALGAPAAAQLTLPEVRAVEFTGNESFPPDSLSRAIATRATECRTWAVTPLCWLGFALRRSELREREVPRDEARLEIWYQRRGFRGVDVTSTTEFDELGRAIVRFDVIEGRPVITDDIRYLGTGEFEGTDLLEGLPARAGEPWSTLRLDATRDTLQWRLMSRGYPNVDVLRQTVFPSEDPFRADVTFEVEPGQPATYGDIRVLGLQNVDSSTVLRTLPFRTGDPYRVDQLIDGQARLFGLEIVRSATITPCVGEAGPLCADLLSSPDSLVPLVVQVQEGDPYRVRGGAGLNTAECLNVESRWTSRNFGGGGRVLQVRGRLANILSPQFHDVLCWQSGQEDFTKLTWQAGIDFAQPWIFSTRNSFNASLFAERQSVPEIFIREAVGLQLALVRRVGPQTPLTLSYRPELSSLDAAEILLCTGFLVCTRDDLRILAGTRRLAPLGLNLTRDLSNSLLNPTSGYRLVVDLEHAAGWTGSEFRYSRAVVEGTWYARVTGSSVLATRMRGGWVGAGRFGGGEVAEASDIVHPQKRFYAGGANSVRGFGQSRLGPRVLSIDPVSLFGVCAPAQVIDLTCDATGLGEGEFISRPTGGTRVVEGNVELRFSVARELEAVTFGDFGQVWQTGDRLSAGALELTPGIGIRYLSPLGPIRVDLGYNFRGEERLSVVTGQIAEWNGPPVGADFTFDGQDYVFTNELAVLGPEVLFTGRESRFQLHISIGQAF